MVTFYDYLNIGFYIVFIIGVGFVFAKKSKNTSDYFRGGGVMPWWVTGASSWMASFSAWTFTGAAGKIYETGPYVLGLYYSSIIPLLIVLSYTCYRFRRMRVVTPLEAVRLRFGASSQQFYTWMRMPFLLLFGGAGLNAVGVFMSAVFDVNLTLVLVVLGLLVTLVALLGGSYSVAANDFVQMFLVVTVAVVVAVLSLHQSSIGGVAGLVAKAPTQDLHWGEIARPELIVFWVMALAINSAFGMNSMDNSAKYLMAASDRQARLMLIIPLLGTLIGPLIWIIPPMAASVTHSDTMMSHLFPQLSHPHEAAFLVTAADVLPQGMLGLLICGIFASTITNLDASLNQGAGIFVRNFYLPIVQPNCPEKKLLILSKVITGCFGVSIIIASIIINDYRTSGLFEFLNQLGISLLLPLTIPLALGLFYKRTPSWSTWSTVVLGLLISYWVKFHTGPGWLSSWLGISAPYSIEEQTIYYICMTVVAVSVACIPWFFLTSLFYRYTSADYKASVEEFFSRLSQPVEAVAGRAANEDIGIAKSIGKLCLIYGSFVLLLVFIPNSVVGRLCFVFCGGIMTGMGAFLTWFYHRRARRTNAMTLNSESGPEQSQAEVVEAGRI